MNCIAVQDLLYEQYRCTDVLYELYSCTVYKMYFLNCIAVQNVLYELYCRESKVCWGHEDCGGNQKCVNGYCGDKVYFEALQNMRCTSDDICKVSHLDIIDLADLFTTL